MHGMESAIIPPSGCVKRACVAGAANMPVASTNAASVTLAPFILFFLFMVTGMVA